MDCAMNEYDEWPEEDNNKTNNYEWVVVTIIIMFLWFCTDHSKLTNQAKELKEYKNQVEELEAELSTYKEALEQANSNIEDAKNEAWSSYTDMGYALDNLETVGP